MTQDVLRLPEPVVRPPVLRLPLRVRADPVVLPRLRLLRGLQEELQGRQGTHQGARLGQEEAQVSCDHEDITCQ